MPDKEEENELIRKENRNLQIQIIKTKLSLIQNAVIYPVSDSYKIVLSETILIWRIIKEMEES